MKKIINALKSALNNDPDVKKIKDVISKVTHNNIESNYSNNNSYNYETPNNVSSMYTNQNTIPNKVTLPLENSVTATVTQENYYNHSGNITNDISHQPIKTEITKVIVPAQKEIKNFTLEEAIEVYFCTDHWSCKSVYDFKRYFSDAFECILKNIKQYDIQLSQEKVLRQKEIDKPVNETKNITKATNINKIKDFVVIDTETTGLKCGGNDIIEICAIKFIDFKPVEKFHTYLKPRKPIPTDATAINNITDEMVANAPKFSQVKTSLQNFIGNFPIVAHNASFDIKFLHVSGLDLSAHTDKIYDTLHLARLKLRDYDGSKYDSYKLSDLCIENNIACTNFHSADSDTLACGILFVDIIKQVKEVTDINELMNY